MNSVQAAQAAIDSKLEAMKIAHDESIKALDNGQEDKMAKIQAMLAAMKSK
jgi:hypothetical protein